MRWRNSKKEERGTRHAHRGPTLHIGGAGICLRWLHAPTSSCEYAYLRGTLHFISRRSTSVWTMIAMLVPCSNQISSLSLGHHFAARKPHDTSWRLERTRISLLLSSTWACIFNVSLSATYALSAYSVAGQPTLVPAAGQSEIEHYWPRTPPQAHTSTEWKSTAYPRAHAPTGPGSAEPARRGLRLCVGLCASGMSGPRRRITHRMSGRRASSLFSLVFCWWRWNIDLLYASKVRCERAGGLHSRV